VTVRTVSFLGFGALFGFLLSRAGATTFDHYAGLFLFRDLQLLWVIGVAVVTGSLGVLLLQWRTPRSLYQGEPLSFTPKPWKRGLVLGSLLFGAGWGLTASCPGTALAMIGEGKLAPLFTLAGILAGTWLYGWQQDRSARRTG
jgi:uncharacterized membrane protein YedE/YeeE